LKNVLLENERKKLKDSSFLNLLSHSAHKGGGEFSSKKTHTSAKGAVVQAVENSRR
jgi:hypothetical protein